MFTNSMETNFTREVSKLYPKANKAVNFYDCFHELFKHLMFLPVRIMSVFYIYVLCLRYIILDCDENFIWYFNLFECVDDP